MNYHLSNGFSALHIAAKHGFKTIVLDLLQQDKLEYETLNRITTDEQVPTLLLNAVLYGWTDVVDLIAEKLTPMHV